MNVPNILTIVRLTLVPVFIFVFFLPLPSNLNLVYASIIFIVAGATDVLDGYIARKYSLVTKWGQVMDPLADKLMQLTVLVCLTIDNRLPIWIIIIYGLKELVMIFGGVFLYTKKGKTVIPANYFGKLATVLFYIAVMSLVFNSNYSLLLFGIAVTYSLVAFIQYLFIIRRKLKKMGH